MPFNSLGFGFFFAATYLLFLLSPAKLRAPFLVVASYTFYGFASVGACGLLAALSLVSFFGAAAIQKQEAEPARQRRTLTVLVSLIVLLLCFFKYFNFVYTYLGAFSDSVKAGQPKVSLILMPLGLSYYIFQSIGYLVDVYWGKERETSLMNFLLFLSFFPKLLMGPIERGEHLLPQLRQLDRFKFNYDNFRHGLLLFLWGLFKKVVVADRLALYVNQAYGAPQENHGLPMLVAIILFAFQLYADFSGYTDMALGAAKLFNLELVNNFARPFYAPNIQEFWRRWHISLSSWVATFVFTPLRMAWRNSGRAGLAGAIILTFLLIGVWHGTGWTYALFGLLHGVFVWVSTMTWKNRESFWKRQNRQNSWLLLLVRRLSTFALVCFAFIFFRAPSVTSGLEIIRSALHPAFTGLQVKDVAAAIAAILGMEIGEWLIFNRAALPRLTSQPLWIRWPAYTAMILVILCFGMFSNPKSFIYFDF